MTSLVRSKKYGSTALVECNGKLMYRDEEGACYGVCPVCCHQVAHTDHTSNRDTTEDGTCVTGPWTAAASWDGNIFDGGQKFGINIVHSTENCAAGIGCNSFSSKISFCICLPEGSEIILGAWGEVNDGGLYYAIIVDGTIVHDAGVESGSECSARVEGDFNTVVYTITDPGLHCIEFYYGGDSWGPPSTGKQAIFLYLCQEASEPEPARMDFYNEDDDTDTVFAGSTWLAQSFYASDDYEVTSVKLKLKRVSSSPTGDVDVEFRATDVNGRPTGAALGSASIASSSIDTTADWYEFDFSGEGVELDEGTKYAIVVSAPDDDMRWRRENANNYGNGDGHRSTNSGSSWDTRTWSFMFEVWGV